MKQPHFIKGMVKTPAGDVPVVSTRLELRDRLGAMMVRWSFNRGNYRILPGLYASGNPAGSSEVFVTANYKLSFDHLRKNLSGMDAWILVLDTKGVNVWCAAGKGTFGTKELVNRIRQTRLEEVISHRRIIVPQLGATGVSAHEVRHLTGNNGQLPKNPAASFTPPALPDLSFSRARIIRPFQVVYGPVKASHIKEFVANRYVATPEMRRVTFTLPERAVLIPNDFIYGLKRSLVALMLIFLLSGLSARGYSLQALPDQGPNAVGYLFLGYLAGILLTPLALPWLPGRMFALKGFFSGVIVFLLVLLFVPLPLRFPEAVAWFFLMTSVSSFTAMNFTGSSTYTSLSGVRKEMKTAIPFQIAFASIGLILLVIDKLI